jgi:hypothetical protein
VDFLHQFCRPVVPKEDKAPPYTRSGCRLLAVTLFAGGIFRAAGIRFSERKCAGFDSPRGL